MAFIASIILLLFYFIRPQDWVPGMAGFNIFKPVVALALFGLFSRDAKENKWKLLSTPVEWAMVFYLIYVVYTSPDAWATFTDLGSLVLVGIIVMHSLTNEWLLERFLRWWMISLMVLLVIALLTLIGLDITNARPIWDPISHRFCLNTWLLNNPNAFGHTMVTLLPLTYYLLFYMKAFTSRIMAVVVMILTLYSIVPTQSKGSFLAGAVGFTASMLFGRKLVVQIVLIALAAGLMGTVLATLPRMEGMRSLRSDEGVMGRLMAWEQARAVADTKSTGEGYKKFVAIIRWEDEMYVKATHSTYVKIGADLGYWGMIFFAGMLVVALRTLMQFPGLTEGMERSRRALFSLVVTYCISGWMIDRPYHTELFFFLGAIGAYHQLSLMMRKKSKGAKGGETEDEDGGGMPVPAFPSPALALPYPSPQPAMLGPSFAMTAVNMDSVPAYRGHSTDLEEPEPEQEEEEGKSKRRKLWQRIGILDCLLAWGAAELIFWFWDYLMRSI